jgi:DNA-binding CsgD family transcriptional regulator/tetratricopeptide (TPR) repeat protein
MARRLASRVFAGRAAELEELTAAMTRATGGAPLVVVLGGEAGMGKSRLLAELATRASDRSVRVLWGACVGMEEAAIPLLPVTEALLDLGDDATKAPGPAVSGLPAPAAASDRTRLVGGPPTARPHALVLERLRQASASAPVLLVLEDIHWADRSTLDLVAFLARRLRDERILVAASFRSEEVDRHDGLRALLAAVATVPTVLRLELTGLTAPEMRVQIAGIAGADPPEATFDAIFTRSGGNPFFAEELLADSKGGSDGGLSPTLRDMLSARIAALPAGAKAVVSVAAVGGRHVHHRVLAAAGPLAEPELTEALRAAVRDHVLVVGDDGFGFRHGLLREVAHAELLPGERARLHAALAAALEPSPDVAESMDATVAAELAHHWLCAGDTPRALTAAVRAGAAAERVGALAEAGRHHERALALWDAVAEPERPAGVDRATLLARAANATAWTGRGADAIDLMDAAIAIVDPVAEPARAARLHQRRGLYLWWLERGAEGVHDFERAVELIPAAPPSADRAHALARLGLILALAGRHAESREHCEAAVAAARTVGARVDEADALATLGLDLDVLGDRGAGLELLERARSIAVDVRDDEMLSQTAIALSTGLMRGGRLEEAIEVALAGAEESGRAGADMREGLCRLNAAEAAYELGRWDLVDRLDHEVLAREPSGTTLAFAHHMAGTLARARGNVAAAEMHLSAERAAIGPDPTPESAMYALEAEAELAISQGALDAASEAAGEGVRRYADDPLHCLLLASIGLRAEADRAELARARRDGPAEQAARERAATFLHAARERAEEADHPALAAMVEAEHARVEGTIDPARWEAAARAWEERPAPYEAARARWRQAEAALALRDRALAAPPLRAAHATATSLGAAGLRRELEDLARRGRIDLQVREHSGSSDAASVAPAAAAEFGLTPRETEVLAHLALGETNRQIADDLYISVKTAGLHVSHILAKLGAANRGEAAAIAHRLRIVP